MTLKEKVGQLSLNVGDVFNTGPTVNTRPSNKFDELIRQGRVTGIFNTHGTAYLRRLQKIAMEESRLKIPLVFGADVIHGFRTVLPIPLAEAASWDMKMVERSSQIAATEATAAGINFNFAPMVDITRDPRWGRIAEGAGEDPYLGSLVAAARVRGFQGNDLTAPNTLAACVKHFAAYGAPHGGREYNTVDMSER
ncbi:MAG TPA: glycosyl hydrolase, partial [Microscillaceae bacterium]|nr:glycosyl hydrolase [Microscillaceae bacterium]